MVSISSLDPVQSLDTVICGIFQMYRYNNLFNPDINSKMQNNKKLTKKKTIETLLYEIFVLDQNKNEETIQQYAQKQGIKVT